jgi:endoglucanase
VRPTQPTRRDVLAGLGAAAGSLALGAPARAQGAALRKRRAQKLQRGLMAAQWFEWVPNDPWKMHRQVDNKYMAEDFATLRKLGFDHIRVSIQPGFPAPQLGPKGDPKLDPMRLEVLDEAMSRILKNDMAVVLDCHPAPQTKDKVAQIPEYRQAMTQWWADFAAHVVKQGQYSPETTYLELMNEPEKSFEEIPLYRATMDGMIAAVRKTARDYTIIVGGPAWNVAEGIFQGLKTPFADENIIYPFHFYKPMEFTHQGLGWAGPLYGKLRDMPWDVEKGSMTVAQIQSYDPSIQKSVQRYNDQPKRKADLAWPFVELRKWCEQHGQIAWLGEFGVMRTVVKPEHRAAWIRDVRQLAEENNFGWNMAEARGGMGLFLPGEERPLKIEEPVLRALGMA